jgi:hypothetical protein
MRTAAVCLVLSLIAAPSRAQDLVPVEGCYPVAAGVVEVTPQSGPVRKGTLLCIGNKQVVLASEGRVEAVDLAGVTSIVKPADGIGDGFLKGAAVAALVAVLCRGCGDAGQWASAVVVYGGIGALVDALHGGRETVYQRSESSHRAAPVSVAWRVRF